MGAGTGEETCRRLQDRNGDGNGDGNESSRGDRNGDEDGNRDGNRDGNEDGIGEGGRKAKKRKKPHNSCRHDQALLLRTRHHLCRQGVALAVIRQPRSQGLVSVRAH